MTIKELGMTEEQAVNEIQFMRMFDKYLQKVFGAKEYRSICNGFSRMLCSAELKMLGATDEQIAEACAFAEASIDTDCSWK